ncbi:MAG TPA: response regulator [Tepidisphaeraceae bacterium]|nr:response regulator [Tepidisphaeraceae bacterium]
MKAKEPSAPPPGGAREVLIVEDETRLRDMLSRAVREMGFNAIAASTAETALRYTENRQFDILVLDLNLPGMSGLDMLERLRESQPDVQVIILTGFGDLEAARKAIHLEVVDFLTKPCALGSLEQALDRARRRKFKVSELELPELPPEPEPMRFTAPEPTDPALSLEELEQRHILAVLDKNNGNRNTTAAELGISVRKLYYRLGQYQKQGLLP